MLLAREAEIDRLRQIIKVATILFEKFGLASVEWRAVYLAACLSNWAGLTKPSAEWRRRGL